MCVCVCVYVYIQGRDRLRDASIQSSRHRPPQDQDGHGE